MTILRDGQVYIPNAEQPVEAGDELLFVVSADVEDTLPGFLWTQADAVAARLVSEVERATARLIAKGGDINALMAELVASHGMPTGYESKLPQHMMVLAMGKQGGGEQDCLHRNFSLCTTPG